MFRKKIEITIILSLLGVFATACGSPPKGKEIPNTLIPSKTEIVLPTETPNPTVTQLPTEIPIADPLDVNNYRIVYGYIEEKRGGAWQSVVVPYEAGHIAYVEVHEGKMYGIDTTDRAVVVRNEAGEWEKFVRPLIGNDLNSYEYQRIPINGIPDVKVSYHTDENINFAEISLEKISRLTTSDGQPLTWGLIPGSYEWNGILPFEGFANFSGYFIGKIDFQHQIVQLGTGKVFNYPLLSAYIFEIPSKYYRQFLFLKIYGRDINLSIAFDNIYGKQKPQRVNLNGDELGQIIDGNLKILAGSQTVIGLHFSTLKENDSTQIFWKNMTAGNPGYIPYVELGGYYWFPSKFMPGK